MTLLSDLSQIALALLLGFLAGPFVRNIRGLCETDDREALSKDRLLGIILYGSSLVVGALGCSEASHILGTSLPVYGVALVLWMLCVRLGLKKSVTAKTALLAAKLATAILVLFLATARGAFAYAEGFLLLGLLVWLFTTLRSPSQKSESRASNQNPV